MSLQISHSAKEKYLKCPMAYYMHYILKLREEIQGSALSFGTAIDNGTEALFKGKSLEDSIKVFDESWLNPKVNGIIVDIKNTDKIKYSKGDSKDGLSDLIWENMQIKGHMMLENFANNVMSEIKEVLGTQVPINVENSFGDYINGLADVIAIMNDNKRYVVDVKTSGSAYDEKAVTNLEGPQFDKAKQIALYYYALGDDYNLDGGGFFVLDKSIRKTERTGPRVRHQIILSKDVPDEIINLTLQEFNDTIHNIKMARFESNSPNCNSYFGECICKKYVESNGENTTGLICTKKDKR